jgi:hypothetical protein
MLGGKLSFTDDSVTAISIEAASSPSERLKSAELLAAIGFGHSSS